LSLCVFRASSGQEFRIGNTIPTIEEAAVAASRICRYAGRTKIYWSVLIHSLIVSDICDSPIEKFYALFHDSATESILNDILHGLKDSDIKELEFFVYCKTLNKWKLPLPDEETKARIHDADVQAYLGEIKTVAPDGHFLQYNKRIPKSIERLTRKYMRWSDRPGRERREVREFLKRFYRLRREAFGF